MLQVQTEIVQYMLLFSNGNQMKIIVFTNELGGVSVCTPTQESLLTHMKSILPSDSIILESSELPADNDFFDAWELVDGTVTVNFIKAQNLTKSRLRIEREPLLLQQDILFQRALETGSDHTAIVVEKNRLRDITNLVDAATILAELRSLSC